jgi:hypothetical protein
MMNRKRLLIGACGSLLTLPMAVIFILISVNHQVYALTVFWSIFFGVTLASAVGLILSVYNDQ